MNRIINHISKSVLRKRFFEFELTRQSEIGRRTVAGTAYAEHVFEKVLTRQSEIGGRQSAGTAYAQQDFLLNINSDQKDPC